MPQCADHVIYQLPNETTRVTYLLDAIECNDAPLQAAMALVRNDTGAAGKMNDFEATASFILPHCPIAKKRQFSNKRNDTANVSDATVSFGGGEDKKASVGELGVEFRYYDTPSNHKLSKDQQEELRTWRRTNDIGTGATKKCGKPKDKARGRNSKDKAEKQPPLKKMRSMIAEAVAKELKTKKDTESSRKEAEQELHQYLVSLF